MYDDTNDDTYGEDFIVNYDIMSVFPAEHDMVSEVSEADEYFIPDEFAEGKPLCYYVMNNGMVEEQKTMFERPSPGMMYHLKPSRVSVGTTTRSMLFMVIKSRANFNLLLGQEWIHGIGAVSSNVNQRLIIWKKDRTMENIEVDQSYYKINEAKGAKKSFDQHLANIVPCDDESGSYTSVNTGRVLNVDPDYGFIWDAEEKMEPEMVIPPTGWPTVDEYDCCTRKFGSNFGLFG